MHHKQEQYFKFWGPIQILRSQDNWFVRLLIKQKSMDTLMVPIKAHHLFVEQEALFT